MKRSLHLPRFYALLILLTSVFSFLGNAQSDGVLIDKSLSVYIPFSITHYSTKHGLPQNQVIDIIQKKNGELVLATANGILEYDGVKFDPISSTPNYKNHIHEKLFWDEKNKRLLGQKYGGTLSFISPKFQDINSVVFADIHNDTIFGLDKDGNLNLLSLNSFKRLRSFSTRLKTSYLISYFKGNCFVGGPDGLFKINIKNGNVLKLYEGQVRFFKVNPYSGKVYVFNGEDLFEMDHQGNKKLVDLQYKDGIQFINDMDFIDESEYFVGSTKGLFYVTPYYVDFYDKNSYLPSSHIQSLLYLKSENCLMVGTGNRGLLKLQLKNCSSINEGSDITEASLGSVIRDHNGNILVAGSNQKIYSIRITEIIDFIQAKSSFSSLSEINNLLYAGTWGDGVILYEDGKEVSRIVSPKIKSHFVHSSYKDSKGRIWIGNSSGVSVGNDPASIQPFLEDKITGRIISIFELKNGIICLGGSKGVFFIDQNLKLRQHLTESDGLKCKEVRSFYEDGEGKLWIGTYDGGLFCFHNKKLTSINALPNCKLNDDVFTLAKDDQDNIYMTSNTGLWMVNERKLDAFFKGKIPYLVPFFYGNETGILNTEFNGGFQNNFLKTKYGHFYFPTIEGILIATPEELNFRKLKPQISSVRLDRISKSGNYIQVERDVKVIEFLFHCPNFLSKYNVHYQFSLSKPGMPKKWESLEKEAKVRFTLLPPGEYIFSLRAIDGFNDDNPHVEELRFTILPYFYETNWFKTLVALIIALLILGIIRVRINYVKRSVINKNKVNNQLLAFKLQAVQAKMNPHFIFNSLNNINYLLTVEKYEEAEEMLQEFSLLLREVLEKSDFNFLKLSEELRIIELYLIIEQKRYNYSFDFKINCSNELWDIEVPTMLIQPFVENALKHGIAHSNVHGVLSINVVKGLNEIMIKIEDNGIGRTASQKINSSRKGHNSKGMKLVQEKIDLVRMQYGLIIELEIVDLKEPTGTIVRIKIPLND